MWYQRDPDGMWRIQDSSRQSLQDSQAFPHLKLDLSELEMQTFVQVFSICVYVYYV